MPKGIGPGRRRAYRPAAGSGGAGEAGAARGRLRPGRRKGGRGGAGGGRHRGRAAQGESGGRLGRRAEAGSGLGRCGGFGQPVGVVSFPRSWSLAKSRMSWGEKRKRAVIGEAFGPGSWLEPGPMTL